MTEMEPNGARYANCRAHTTCGTGARQRARAEAGAKPSRHVDGTRMAAVKPNRFHAGTCWYSVGPARFMWTWALSQATIEIGTVHGFSKLRCHVKVASAVWTGDDERV